MSSVRAMRGGNVQWNRVKMSRVPFSLFAFVREGFPFFLGIPTPRPNLLSSFSWLHRCSLFLRFFSEQTCPFWTGCAKMTSRNLLRELPGTSENFRKWGGGRGECALGPATYTFHRRWGSGVHKQTPSTHIKSLYIP